MSVIDETLLMEQDPVVQHRLLETETSLYGALVNPRGTCHLLRYNTVLTSRSPHAHDWGRFVHSRITWAAWWHQQVLALHTRSWARLRIHLIGEYAQRTRFEQVLARRVSNWTCLGRCARNIWSWQRYTTWSVATIVEQREHQSKWKSPIWATYLSAQLAARSWDGSCTTDKSALKKSLLSFEESNITLKIRDECHTDPVLNRTMAHYKHDVEYVLGYCWYDNY